MINVSLRMSRMTVSSYTVAFDFADLLTSTCNVHMPVDGACGREILEYNSPVDHAL